MLNRRSLDDRIIIIIIITTIIIIIIHKPHHTETNTSKQNFPSDDLGRLEVRTYSVFATCLDFYSFFPEFQ